ncbi:MAG: hypothetical protein HGB12_16620, partial [Bacteroidetes bacterium]|nr:hypothetical protein [Bacteroidota bacterium]
MIALKPNEKITNIVFIGAGGNNGYIIPHIARIVSLLSPIKRPTISIIDFDIVEDKNLVRQNFIFTDVGKYKSEVLAMRYSAVFGMSINYAVHRFTHQDLNTYLPYVNQNYKTLCIEGVDKFTTKLEIAKAIKQQNRNTYNNIILLSSGNTEDIGQAVSGPDSYLPDLFPTAFSPEVLEQERLQEINTANCIENVISVPQNLAINLTAAMIVVNMAYQWIFDRQSNWRADGSQARRYLLDF